MDHLEYSDLHALLGRGYLTLQVQTDVAPTDATKTIPDNWICWLSAGERPISGNESGFCFLTSVGWEANKEAIQKDYLEACHRGEYRGELFEDRPWVEGVPYFSKEEEKLVLDELDKFVENHFSAVRKSLKRCILQANHKLEEAQEFGTPNSVKYWKRKLKDLEGFEV